MVQIDPNVAFKTFFSLKKPVFDTFFCSRSDYEQDNEMHMDDADADDYMNDGTF